jgi:glycosyltransferase involved in cell wall biosynthesis
VSSDRGLTIGVDARAAAEVPAGRGRFVREMLRALAALDHPHRLRLYARRAWPANLDERFAWSEIDARDPWWHVRAAARATRECDVFLSTNSYLTTILLGVPAVTVVYDLVTFDRAMKPNRRSVAIERLTLGLAVRRSRALLAISQSTADELVSRFPRARAGVRVVPLAAAPAPAEPLSQSESATLPPPGFVLAVGTLEPRKNLPRLVAAYAALPELLQRAHPLVVVGARGWQEGETLDALRSLGQRAHVLGHVSDGALAELYRRCTAFCYPSLGEGFGLPVLEAMSAGAPVITSNLSSLPEVSAGAALLVDPRDTSAISAGLTRVLEDPGLRRRMATDGIARAAEYSWERTARETLALLSEAAAR